jgi:hypothetical protein
MQLDGTYSYVFSGTFGAGMGAFRIKGGLMSGGDFNGVDFSGTIGPAERSDMLEASLTFDLPGALGVVQKVLSPGLKQLRSRTFHIPADFTEGKPFEAHADPVSAWLIVKRIHDFSTWPALVKFIGAERQALQSSADKRFGTSAYLLE